jgi:hypothetical protein
MRQLPLFEVSPLPVRAYVRQRLRDLAVRQAARDERRRRKNATNAAARRNRRAKGAT